MTDLYAYATQALGNPFARLTTGKIRAWQSVNSNHCLDYKLLNCDCLTMHYLQPITQPCVSHFH